FGLSKATFWQQVVAILAVLLPQFALHLFEAMIPHEGNRSSRLLRFAGLLSVPMVLLVLSPYKDTFAVRIAVFLYVFALVTAGLYTLGQRGKMSPSRDTQ